MTPRLFCEFPAGLASVSLRLHGGEYCRPPISRMGNKAGYAAVILAALGLRSGSGAGAYWWAEADDDVRALLRCYPDAAMLRRVAEIIRGWADEEPRALWERLRAERKARGPESARQTAEWVAVQGVQYGSYPIWTGASGSFESPAGTLSMHPNRLPDAGGKWPDTAADACHRLAEYAMIATSNRLINVAGPDLTNTGAGGTTFGGEEFATPAREVGERFEGMAEAVAAHVVEHAGTHPGGGGFRGGHKLYPSADGFYPQRGEMADRFEGMAREVAGWAAVAVRTMPQAQARGANDGDFLPRIAPAGCTRYAPDAPASGMVALARGGWPPVRITRTIPTAAEVADALGTPGDLEGVVVYMDPPYLGTTGYLHDLGRDEVVRIAYEFDRLGAVVAISEAEVVIPEWRSVEITAGRKGQKRTFSKQQQEWITMNREPAHRVAVQSSMFALKGVS